MSSRGIPDTCNKVIKLPCYDIVIKDFENISTIEHSSNLVEVCPHCNESHCCYSCDESQENGFEVAERLQYNGVLDGITALILAHHQAGIDVTTPEYIEGIETAIEAAENE